MKYLITLILMLGAMAAFSQTVDSTYAVIKNETWHIGDHPDSIVGADLVQGPETALNVYTGEFFLQNPSDSTWDKIVDLTVMKERDITTISDTTTLDRTYYTVLCDASTRDILINLPDASTYKGQYNIKMIASGFTITIDAFGAQEIDGDLTQTITTLNNSITIVSDGTAWYII